MILEQKPFLLKGWYGKSREHFIPLKIDTSLNDTDGSEILEIIIEDIPTGAILNNGVQKDGKWYLTIDDLTNLLVIQHGCAYNVVIDFNRSGQWRPWGSRSGAGGKK